MSEENKERTRQAAWKGQYPTVPVPAQVKEAVKAYAESSGKKIYRAVGDILAESSELQPYLQKEAANA
ncbi:MAG: hypothetical protein IJT92_03470 [Spirochaetia bacterium]|nr:hypothetical protein [Spirochaetia bacterium]MBR0318932.1 hypothetical protein [Spirochaetia bacterium]